MVAYEEFGLEGHGGALAGYRWEPDDPAYVLLLCHGYGEHMGRYYVTASALSEDGAVVFGVDHYGHGKSEGDRVAFTDFDAVVDDFDTLAEYARSEFPGLPVVLVGHSMGGMIGARYGQLHGTGLSALVLSAPVLGSWAPLDDFDPAAEPAPIALDSLSHLTDIQAAYERDPLVWHGGMKEVMVDAMRRGLADIAAGGHLEVPTLWMHGDEDSLVPYEATKAGWADIVPEDHREIVWPGIRHEMFNDVDADRAIDATIEWIDAHL